MLWCRFSAADAAPAYGLIEDGLVHAVDGDPLRGHAPTGRTVPLAQVQLLAPVEPRSMYSASNNFAAHGGWVRQYGVDVAPAHHFGHRSVSALSGPGEAILLPADAPPAVEAEAELIAVIGRQARDVSADEAAACILGYTLGNDLGIRGWQKTDRTNWRWKNGDTLKPIGPAVATALDPMAVTIETAVNGVSFSSWSTSDMRVSPAELVSQLSRYVTLAPGDLVWLGSGASVQPELHPGDVVSISAAGIGDAREPGADPVSGPPFDASKLDDLLAEAGVDWILATSRANTRYLLGGHRYFFHAAFDAIGVSRYLPIVGYRRGRPEDAFYVAAPNEVSQLELAPVWLPRVLKAEVAVGPAVAAAAAAIGERPVRIAIETPFFPADGYQALRQLLSDVELVDGTEIFEALRAIKTERELDLLRRASVGIVDAMLATFAAAHPGISKGALATAFEGEVVRHGLRFEYAFIAAGKSLNRTPSGGAWLRGEMLSLDSGGELEGYIGDLCRMASFEAPTQQMVDALGEVATVQDAIRAAVRGGALGAEVITAGRDQLDRSPRRQRMRAIAHGMGLVSHEAPRLAKSGIPYQPAHAEQRLEPGMVISVETHLADPDLGFVKLEDTLFVTEDGFEAVGDYGRDWNIAGQGVRP